jgi:hypothetical protein
MLYHLSDDEITVGFFQVDLDPPKVAKKLSKIFGTTFEVITSNRYEEIGSFEVDTLIVRSNVFTEDLIDLLDYGIAVYIIDY